MKKQLIFLLASWTLLYAWSCSGLKEKEPVLPADTATGPMPTLVISLKEGEDAVLDLEKILPQNEPYTLRFGDLRYGTLRMANGGKSLSYHSDTTGWKSDSTTFEYCRKGKCRTGIFKVLNLDYKPDTLVPNDTLPAPVLSPVYLPYLSSVEVNLVPPGVDGKIVQVRHQFYSANIQTPDSTHMLYFAGGGGTQGTYGFDDVVYVLKAQNGDVYKGKMEVILGDTCEAQARNDFYIVSGNSASWLPAQWFQNDEPCFSTEENYLVRIRLGEYSSTSIPTPNGILTDTLINGQQELRYRRTNLSATTDTWTYYVKAGFNNRITRAKVKLTFQ